MPGARAASAGRARAGSAGRMRSKTPEGRSRATEMVKYCITAKPRLIDREKN